MKLVTISGVFVFFSKRDTYYIVVGETVILATN